MTFIQKQALWVSRDANGNINLHFPTTHVAYVEGGVATVNGATPDENKNVTITDITGNSATATKLKSAISINNVAFDGTKNINIPVGVKTVNGIEPSADGDVVVAGVPIGFEYISFNPNIPTGSLPLLGGTFSRTAYKDLWEWVQTQTGYLITEAEWQEKATANDGNVSFYSDGDGSTTFRVPAIFCWAKGANNAEEVGSYLSDMFGSHRHSAMRASSAQHTDDYYYQVIRDLNSSSTGRFKVAKDSGGELYVMAADTTASDYESTSDITYAAGTAYTGGEETRPKSVVGMWLVKAFGTVSNVGNQDIADVSAGLTSVEERLDSIPFTARATAVGDASETKPAVVVESYRSGASWYRKWSDGWIEQGGHVTSSNFSTTVQLITPFTTTDYTLIALQYTDSGTVDMSIALNKRTLSNFTIGVSDYSDVEGFDWYACGI